MWKDYFNRKKEAVQKELTKNSVNGNGGGVEQYDK